MSRNIHPHVMRALDDVADTVKWWTGPRGLRYGSDFIGVRIWIEPYIKGPQSLPLKVKDKAYAWRQ